MLQSVRLISGLILFLPILFRFQAYAHSVTEHKLGTITIKSIATMDPMPVKPYPYLRLIKWLSPITHKSLIYRHIDLKPGTIFHYQDLLRIKKKLLALPYFSTVFVTSKPIPSDNQTEVVDIVIQTQDRFPITADFDLEQGPLFTIRHNNAWGYGHIISNQFFLKKRWGYGLEYELPSLNGNYLLGGQCYRQIRNKKKKEDSYKFDFQNLWIGKFFYIKATTELLSYYWLVALSGYNKKFVIRPTVTNMENRPYHNQKFILAKLGWVVDGYVSIKNVYALECLELLPKGGSIEILCGYQKSEYNRNRPYVGMSCIKNVVNTSSSFCKYLHLSCKTAAFLHKKVLEEGVLALKLDYVGSLMYTEYNDIRQFIRMNYITGYRMPKERMLGISERDPEELAKPEKEDLYGISQPINARLHVDVYSTFHRPMVVKPLRFVVLGFTKFIALYNRNNALLNPTLINNYGVALRLAHMIRPWPTLELAMAYSPLLRKMVPSVTLSICHFKNNIAKPTLVPYS
ncbi:hypothetical protein [Candidatus Cardinium hertigii]|nr:hypothetical protein [Candidatus Cardinium hertigii]